MAAAITELRDKIGIMTVAKNYSHQTGYFKAQTTNYRLSEVPDKDVISTTLVSVDEDSWSADLWFHLLKVVFTVDELRKLYPFAWHRIVNAPSVLNVPA